MFYCRSDFFYKSGLHLGGVKSIDVDFNIFNSIFFLGKRKSFYIVDFKHFIYNFRISLFFLYRLISLRGKILGFEDRIYIRRCLIFFFNRANQNYVLKHWIGGTLTNFKNFQIFFTQIVKGVLSVKKYYEFFIYFYGLKNMQQMPSLIILTNPNDSVVSLQESFRIGIPILSLININTKNTNSITFPIPGNNVELKSLIIFYSVIGDSLLFGWLKPVSHFFNLFFKRLKFFRKTNYIYNSLYFSFYNSKMIFFSQQIIKKLKNKLNFFLFNNFFYYLKKKKFIKTNFIINLKSIRYKKFKKKFFKYSFFNFWFTRKILKSKKLKRKKLFKKLFKYRSKKKKIKIFKLFKKRVKFFFKNILNLRFNSILKRKKKLDFIIRYNRYKNYYKKLIFKNIYLNVLYEQDHLETILEQFDELPEERKLKSLKKWKENFEKLNSKYITVHNKIKIFFVNKFNSNILNKLYQLSKKTKIFFNQHKLIEKKKNLNFFFFYKIKFYKMKTFVIFNKNYILKSLLRKNNLNFVEKKNYSLNHKINIKNYYIALLAQRRQSFYRNKNNKIFIKYLLYGGLNR